MFNAIQHEGYQKDCLHPDYSIVAKSIDLPKPWSFFRRHCAHSVKTVPIDAAHLGESGVLCYASQ